MVQVEAKMKFLVALISIPLLAQTPVLLDTDIGDDIDDAFALALALRSREIRLVGVTTVFKDAYSRSLIALRMLRETGRPEVLVAAGSRPQSTPETKGQFQYAVGFNGKPVKELAVDFLYSKLKESPGAIILVAIGPLSNVSALLTKYPDANKLMKRLVIMGGSVRVGYNAKPPAEPEWNIKCDIPAAQAVFRSGAPLTVAPLDATTMLKLEGPRRQSIFASGPQLGHVLGTLYKMWGKPTPVLFDPVAVALSFTERFTKMEDLRLEVDEKGITKVVSGAANARVATSIDTNEFLDWYVARQALAARRPISAGASAAVNTYR